MYERLHSLLLAAPVARGGDVNFVELSVHVIVENPPSFYQKASLQRAADQPAPERGQVETTIARHSESLILTPPLPLSSNPPLSLTTPKSTNLLSTLAVEAVLSPYKQPQPPPHPPSRQHD